MVEASAPSNIALIKYMGKVDGSGNRPTNSSLSWSLDHLLTSVQIEKTESDHDEWQPLEKHAYAAPELSMHGRVKFLNHFSVLKKELGGNGNYLIRSANNFPSDCGLASSASSFAALTFAAAKLFKPHASAEELSKLSRIGSGSSCRSFFSPWSVWKEEGGESIELPYNDLIHAAVVVSSETKKVSSSEAHKRVTTSPHFETRAERAEARMRKLISALRERNWTAAYEITTEEFMDMHLLFESSVPAFSYRTRESEDVVESCHNIWKFKKDGPLITMDAGPNVHLLFRPDQKDLAEKMVKHFREKHIVITSWGGFR